MARAFLFASLAIMLLPMVASCDSAVSISWKKRFPQSVDISCVENTLKTISKDVHRDLYVSDGKKGFPSGISVTQLGYADSMGQGYYDLDIASLPDGSTQYYHGWEKVGNFPSDSYKNAIVARINSNNGKLATACGLKFDQSDFSEGAD